MKVVNQAGLGFAPEVDKVIKSGLSAKHDSASMADSQSTILFVCDLLILKC